MDADENDASNGGGAAKQANMASSGMVGAWDEPFVKVTEVNAAVTRSRWEIN